MYNLLLATYIKINNGLSKKRYITITEYFQNVMLYITL